MISWKTSDQKKSETAKALMTAREQTAWRWATRFFWALIGVTGCLLLSIGGNLYQAAQPKLLPYYIMIDPGGMVLWSSREGPLTLDGIDVGAFLKQWVKNSRRRSDDPVLMGEMRREAELMTIGKALRKLQAYHAATNPKCGKETPECRDLKKNPIRTTIERIRLDQLNETTWHLTWYETWTPTYGATARQLRVTGEFTVERRLRPGPFGKLVMTVADANRSPLALFVTDYSLIEEWEEAR